VNIDGDIGGHGRHCFSATGVLTSGKTLIG